MLWGDLNGKEIQKTVIYVYIELSITSDMQITPSLWQKAKKN